MGKTDKEMSDIIVIEKEALDQQPQLKQDLKRLSGQMVESEHDYSYLPIPQHMESFVRLLMAHQIPFSLPKPAL